MAKKFLDEIDEAFGGEILADVIPHKKLKPSKSAPAKSRSNRKKSFLASLEKNEQKVNKTSSGGRKKSFLDAIEAALEDQSFEDVIPNYNRKSTATAPMAPDLQRLSMAIPKSIMQKLKSLAKRKGVPLNDLIRVALDRYMSEN